MTQTLTPTTAEITGSHLVLGECEVAGVSEMGAIDLGKLVDLGYGLFIRQGLKPLANSESPLKWTGKAFLVHFSGLLLLAREFILWRVIV